ncbi:MAG: uroporphyrinogen decarboxylase family protein, partial [Bacteroidota bacterium]
EDDYAWAKPLALSREDLLLRLSEIDPEERVRQGSAFKMYQALKELSEGMTFAERAVEIVPPGSSTHGIFTKAAEIRGLEQICLDLYDAPDFVEKLLHLVTEKTIARIKACHKLTTGTDFQLPLPEGFHFCDDSLQLISTEMYERFVLPCHERLYSAMTAGKRRMHLCGRSSQHYHTLRHKLNVTAIDGPSPFVDHGQYLRELGPDFSFVAQTDHSVLANGSESQIDEMLRGLLSNEAKIPGRFQVMGFVTRHTPLRNVEICYQAGRKYGAIGQD